MRHEQHEAIARWERRWLAASGVLLVVFVIFIAYSLAIEGRHIGQQDARATPDQLLQRDVFADPGVVETGPGAYRVGVRAQAFSFTPADIRLPAGAETTFYMTSRDVLHGYQVQDTSINVELIPGEVAVFSYTFDDPGEYRITCNEYCGIGHQNMMGTITVLDEETYAAEVEAAEEETEAAEAGDDGADAAALALGRQVYAANCAGCHQANGQGVTGAFPPVAGHSADLLTAEDGRTYLVNLVLYGLQGPIEVQGADYDGVMPAWSQLADDEVAAVLNYVLMEWDDGQLPDDFAPYQPEEIGPLRGQELDAQDVYEMRQDLEPGQ